MYSFFIPIWIFLHDVFVTHLCCYICLCIWHFLQATDPFLTLYCAVISHSVMSDSLWHYGCSLPGSSVHVDPPGKNTGVCCHALLQGIFPTQGSNQGLLHCRRILYHLSHQGGPPYILSILKGPFRWYHLLSPHFRYPDLHSTVVFHPHSRYISKIT